MPLNRRFLAILPLLIVFAGPRSAQAGRIQAYLASISGIRTVAGVHNDQKTGGDGRGNGVSYYTDKVTGITGAQPGLWGGDFSYDAARVGNRWNMVYEAERQWNRGVIPNLMWHACPPTGAEPCDWDGDIHANLSDAQWTDLITEGGKLNQAWKKRMDGIVPYLTYLQDKGVEALFRPQHEMNQGNFWWGGRTGPAGTAALFRLTRDYLVRVKGIRNLTWTWDVQDLSWDWEKYDPGRENWDVFALDVYGHGYIDSPYNSMLRIAGDRPIALGEVGHFPSPAVLARQPRWTFVMGWAYLVQEDNTDAELKSLFAGENVVTQAEMPGWDTVPVGLVPRGLDARRVQGPLPAQAGEVGFGVDGRADRFGDGPAPGRVRWARPRAP